MATSTAPARREQRAEHMDGGVKPEPQCSGLPERTIAIIGGGFSGAAVALQLADLVWPAIRILVFEPRAQLGLGLAYSTLDPAHRLNARAARMSLFPGDPGHFCDWIAATGACDDDAEAALLDGRLFPQRAVFGRYVAAALAPKLSSGRITHVPATVEALEWQSGAWSVRDATGRVFRAEIAVLATGHAAPVAPTVLAPLVGHPGFITEPLQHGKLQAIAKTATVLMIGTGLTMADCVAVLHRNGHTGRICAISRRGQMPRAHANAEPPPYHDFGERPGTALVLLRRVREALAKAAAAGLPWQSVFDGLRSDAEPLWAALPTTERRRLQRHARPFWDTHRHRLPPPTGDILRRRLADSSLVIRPATITAAAASGAQLHVQLRSPGVDMAYSEAFDAVVLTAGFGRIGDSANGLVSRLLAAGLVTLDGTGQGLNCDPQCRVLADPSQDRLFLLGPPARGSFADSTGVPEITRQAACIARRIVTETLPCLNKSEHNKH